MTYETTHLPMERTALAPDGADVRILLGLTGGGLAHFELGAGQTSHAVTHRNVEEIWYFLSGRGQMWRRKDGATSVVDVYPGICLTIPRGTEFQFRSFGYESLGAIGVTMPPWPNTSDEASYVAGPWEPTVARRAKE